MRLPLLLAAFLVLGGCFHHQAFVPGVIDMRTDGSGVPKGRPPPVPARESGTSIALGTGMSVTGADIKVEERHYWVFGAIPIYNFDVTPDLDKALKTGGAMTGLEIGEEIGVIDVAASYVAPVVLPITSWVLPSYTFTARAHAVSPPPVTEPFAPNVPPAVTP